VAGGFWGETVAKKRSPLLILLFDQLLITRRTIMPLIRMFKGDKNLGVDNQYVMLLQRFLALNGLLDRKKPTDPNPVNGDFGVATDEAVKKIQAIYGVPVSGVVDGETWAAIAGVSAPLAIVDPSVPSSKLPDLYPGDTDSVVTVLQRLLVEYSVGIPGSNYITPGVITKADVVASGGFFGPKTEAAVAEFQQDRKLPPPFNAKIGPLTWAKLLIPK
jgi:peptidoglycan hydrolase-like protein with peptidoglycan-binding domain